MANLSGKRRRKIKKPTDSMRKYYADLFVRNQSKWMRRSKLEASHLETNFSFEGENSTLIGSLSSEEVLLHITEANEYIVVHIDDVSREILE